MIRPSRPTEYTQHVAKQIARRCAAGESLVRITQDEEMPGMHTIAQWLKDHPGFIERYHPRNARVNIEVA